MKQTNKIFLNAIILSIFLIYQHSYAIVVGSNSSLTRQGSTTFPAIDTNNTILGFTSMVGGFTLQDSTTTCTYDAFFPVSGGVALNGGLLYLNQDFSFNNVATFTSLGNISGGSHLLALSEYMSSLGALGAGPFTFSDVALQLNSNISLNANIQFAGNSIIDGQGMELDLSSMGSIEVSPGSTLTLQNVVITGVQNTKISCADDTGSIVFDNVNMYLDGNYTFSYGSFSVLNFFDVVGSYTFTYASSQTSTVQQDSNFYIDSDMTFLIGKYSPTTNIQPLEFIDQTSVITFENCIFETNTNGMTFTKGKIRMIRNVTVDVNSTSTANGLTFGDGIMADDTYFELYPGSTTIFPQGHVTFNVSQLNVVKSYSATAQIVRYDQSYWFNNQDVLSQNLTLNFAIGAILVIAPGKMITYENLTAITPYGAFQANAQQTNTSIIELTGGQNVAILAGVFPLATQVSGIGNTISGAGGVAEPIILADSATELTLGISGQMLAPIIMNSGTIDLVTDLTFAPHIQLNGPGNVVLGMNNFILGTSPLTWASPINWQGDSGEIDLHANLVLTTTWTIEGMVTINGHNNLLDLESGQIIVAPGSTLTLSNMTLKNISGTNIVCADNTGVIILENIVWAQSDDFNFVRGALQFANSIKMQGNTMTFSYESSQTSTILSLSNLELDLGFTFSYAPGNNSLDLLEFIDQTSVLSLNGGTFHSVPGLNLTNGSMAVHANSNLESESSSNAITIGNDNAADDFAVSILRGITLHFNTGILSYRNVLQQSLDTENAYSTLYMHDNTTLKLYETLVIGEGRIFFGNNSTLAQAAGISLIGATGQFGAVNFTVAN